MKVATGPKRRVIRSFNANTFELFPFNRSIKPSGGILAKLKLRGGTNGKRRAKVFQDTNFDGRVSRKELIFHGKSSRIHDKDELIGFSGSARLDKQMHMCEWISLKFPGEPLACTEEYIPTIYELILTADSGEVYEFSGIGRFEDPIFK